MSSSTKKLISIRLEPEVLDWFRNKRPRGYQSYMHSVLRNYVMDQDRKEARIAGRAQELYRQYYAQCFWHYKKELEITPENIQLVIDGLQKYGGREGLRLAEDLCQ